MGPSYQTSSFCLVDRYFHIVIWKTIETLILNINNNSFQVAFRARYSLGLSRNGPQNPDCDQIMSARTSANSSFVMSCSCDCSLHDTKIKLKLTAVTQTLLICPNLKYRKTGLHNLCCFLVENKNTDYSWNYPCTAISRQHF